MKKLLVLSAVFMLALWQAVLAEAPRKAPSGASQAGAVIAGKVLETMDSGGYTYVYLQTGGEKLWIAIPQTKGIVKGKQASFQPGFVMTNFESKTLNRTFDRIVFSGGIVTGVKAAKAPATVDGKPFVGSKEAVMKPVGKIKVQKATGANAYTITEIYAKSVSLDNKQVVVRGKVVKVSPGIMKRNWVHIQDGTGDAAKGTHNLVFTSTELPKVGDIVLAGGTLHRNRDFGMGYRYDVIVEEAGFRKQD